MNEQEFIDKELAKRYKIDIYNDRIYDKELNKNYDYSEFLMSKEVLKELEIECFCLKYIYRKTPIPIADLKEFASLINTTRRHYIHRRIKELYDVDMNTKNVVI